MDSDITASTTCNDIALQQAVFACIELNGTVQCFEDAGRIQVNVLTVSRNPTVQVDRCMRTDFAGNVQLAVRALRAADGDG